MEAMAVLEKQQQFDFQNNGIEVMNFETLQRTYKENDIYGKPVQGIYHYQVLQRMMDICEKYNLDYEVEEIFAAQNRNKTQPGVSILPQVEQTLGEKAVEAHILRRIFATIRIKDWETDELTTTLVVAYHQDGIQAAIGPCVKVCHNQCILSPERSICNYGKNKVTTEGVFETVDGVDSADEKVIGKRLQEIAKNATTGGLYTQVGELYGFPIKVVSERILKEGLEFTDNRFVVEGNYKYTYNNGHLAMADPLAAARNFLNAMERIPSIIDQYKAKNEVLEMEIPQLQEIAGKVWKKEDELKQLKSELAALDRKIQLELAPPTPEVAEKENEGQQLKPEAEDVRNRQAQYPENAPPQIRSPADSIVANHVIIGRPGLYAKEETRSKGLKI